MPDATRCRVCDAIAGDNPSDVLCADCRTDLFEEEQHRRMMDAIADFETSPEGMKTIEGSIERLRGPR